MRDRRGRRRRARAVWIRDLDKRQLHVLCAVIAQDRAEGKATSRQEWVWDQCLVELAWHRSHDLGLRKCTCMLCVPVEHATRRARYVDLWGIEDEDLSDVEKYSPEGREDKSEEQRQSPQTDQ